MDDRKDAEGRLRDALAGTAFYGWLGIRLDHAEPGLVVVSLEAEAHHLNVQGLLHGGIIATLADSASGLAIRSQLEPGRRHVTIQLNVHYLAPAKAGRVTATGRAIRVGTQIGYGEAEVVDAHGKVIARAQSTLAVTAQRPPDQ